VGVLCTWGVMVPSDLNSRTRSAKVVPKNIVQRDRLTETQPRPMMPSAAAMADYRGDDGEERAD
jgi:hypothetical protein